ncbi:MAG: cation transporter [Euryarchaeota archaeon]|nr:cation transporter [Euryarchaeota archaeon]
MVGQGRHEPQDLRLRARRGTVDGRVVAAIGAVSLGANLALAALLKRGTGDNLNVRAAYLHIVSDALGSAAALAAGAAVYFWGLHVADPILTLLITVLILVFTWNLTRQTLHILLEGAPAHAHPDEISAALRGVPGVRDVHDLHVWTLASGVDSVSAHVVLHGTPKDDSVSHVIHRELRGRYGIDHVTVQLEDPDCLCETTRHAWAGGQGSSAAPP